MAFREQSPNPDLFDTLIPSAPGNPVLQRINKTVNWDILRDLMAPAWNHSTKKGRPGFDPILLLKLLILEHLYNLSDVRVVREAADRLSFREFLGLNAGDPVPDDTSLVRFRKRLEPMDLLEKVEREVFRQLEEKGLVLKAGAIEIIDATIIEAATKPPRNKKSGDSQETDKSSESQEPSVSESLEEGVEEREEAKEEKDQIILEKRDYEAGFAKRKKKPTVYGYKLHVKRDAISGIITAIEVTPANVHDSQVLPKLVSGKEEAILADKAYDSKEIRELLIQKKVRAGIMYKAKKNKPLGKEFEEMNREYSRVRSRVEQTMAHLKRWRKCARAVYLGIKKFGNQMRLGVMVSNLFVSVKMLHSCNAA